MARILLVDDEEYIRQLYTEELSEESHEVSSLASGHELLRKIDFFQPEAVILDHLGDAYIKVGSKELALKRWKESLELDPTNERLQKKILEFETGAFEPKD